jgi:hypothetical protein
MKYIFILLSLPTLLFSEMIKVQDVATNFNKNKACRQALLNAKVDALEQFGVNLSSTLQSYKMLFGR